MAMTGAKGNGRALRLLAAAGLLTASLVGCSTIEGAKQDVDKVQSVASACSDAAVIGKDAVNLMLAGLNSGAIAFENSGQFIDAVTAMDTEKVGMLGKEVAAGLPEADAKKFRETLDQYGAAVKKCRTGVSAQPTK